MKMVALSLVDPRAQLMNRIWFYTNERRSREQSKKAMNPMTPNHFPELKPEMMSWTKRSLECEQR